MQRCSAPGKSAGIRSPMPLRQLLLPGLGPAGGRAGRDGEILGVLKAKLAPPAPPGDHQPAGQGQIHGARQRRLAGVEAARQQCVDLGSLAADTAAGEVNARTRSPLRPMQRDGLFHHRQANACFSGEDER